tara:strand:+ start:12301 stop:12621 length:321 start_codon:yes stop_codon:yes gene_type:complete
MDKIIGRKGIINIREEWDEEKEVRVLLETIEPITRMLAFDLNLTIKDTEYLTEKVRHYTSKKLSHFGMYEFWLNHQVDTVLSLKDKGILLMDGSYSFSKSPNQLNK